MPFKANAARRHRIPRQRHRVTNWAEYDAALRQRGSLTVWFTDEAVAAWRAEPRTTRGGQPWYSPLAILTALTLRAVFRLGLRQTEGLIGSILRLLGLDLAVPDHTTLSRRAGTLEVPRPRPGRRAAAPAGRQHRPEAGAGPASGWSRSTAPRTRRAWRKLHLGRGRRHRPDRGRGADHERGRRRLPGRAAAGPGGGPGRLVHRRRRLRPRGRVRGGGRAASRGGRRRAAAPGRGAERHGRDRAHPARPAPPVHRRARPPGLAEGLRLQSPRFGGGGGLPLQAGDRRRVALAHRPGPGDRGRHRRLVP